MIRIHRAQPVVEVNHQQISLTPDEHQLLTVLAMMDNRLTPREWLLETMCADRTQIPGDDAVLTVKLSRLRKKIGAAHLRCFRNRGYILVGSVEFIGSPMNSVQSKYR